MAKLAILFFGILGFFAILEKGKCLENSTNPGIPVEYTPYISDAVYANNATNRKFDAKGMQPLYLVTDLFINLVGSDLKKDIPADLVPAEDGNIGDIYSYVKQWLAYERGVVICTGIGVGLAVVIPLMGLVFCCCRCCGKCGANGKKTDRNSDPCQCGCLTTFFVLLCLIMTFGVVCAFVTNEYMRSNVRKVNSTVGDSLQDIQSYLRDSQKHASHILVQNFKEMEDHIKDSLNDTEVTAERLFDSGVDFLGAENLFAFGDRLARADGDITKLDASFVKLKTLEDILQLNVSTIRKWLTDAVVTCADSSFCHDIATAGQNLQLTIDYSNLALSKALADLQKGIGPSVVSQIRDGRSKLNAVRSDLKNEMEKASRGIVNKMEEGRTEILKMELQIRQQANSAQAQLLKLDLAPYFEYVYEYNNYIWYGKLALCVVILFILTMFILATLFGICGSRIGSSGLYEDPFCNKGKGACLMLWGVGLAFFFYFFLAIIVTAMFFVGVNVQLMACNSLTDPTSNNHIRVLGIVLQQQNAFSHYDLKDVPQILQKCHNNEGVYSVMGLNNTYNVKGMMEKHLKEMNIQSAVNDVIDDVTRRIKSTNFLSSQNRTALLALADSPWINQINLDALKEKLSNKDILRGSIDAIVNGTLAIEPLLDPSIAGITFQIRRELLNLDQNVIPSIEQEQANALVIVNDLSSLLVERNPSEDIRNFVNQTKIAEERFQKNSEPIIRRIANDTLDNLERFLLQFLNYSLDEVETKVGLCRPASAAFNSTVDAVCTEIMRPFNGFWLSVGYFLVVLIPALPIAIALAWHYRLPESFRSGSSDSSDYETQTEIDTIPLAHRQERKRIHPSTLDNAAYDSRARQSKATQWAFHNAFKNQPPNGYFPVRKASAGPSAPLGEDSIYTRPPSYYYPGSNS